jgi:hypothetical protein
VGLRSKIEKFFRKRGLIKWQEMIDAINTCNSCYCVFEPKAAIGIAYSPLHSDALVPCQGSADVLEESATELKACTKSFFALWDQ